MRTAVPGRGADDGERPDYVLAAKPNPAFVAIPHTKRPSGRGQAVPFPPNDLCGRRWTFSVKVHIDGDTLGYCEMQGRTKGATDAWSAFRARHRLSPRMIVRNSLTIPTPHSR